jgi:transposase-like protein
MAADMDLPRLIAQYGTDDRCRMVLEKLRWPDGVGCLRCGSDNVVPITTRALDRCRECQYQFSTTVGTIFNGSHLPLTKWFLATYMMVEAKKGVSASQLQRTLDVSYKTAWYLCHRIRAAMREASPIPLDGIVEVDETYVGGKRRHVGRGYRGNKTMVLGAAQRGGPIRLKIEKHADQKTLHGFIRSATKDKTKAIYTDELPAYAGIADHNTKHETVNHHAEEWVRADVHTNTVESVWSLLKRSIVGSYHQLSAKHLPSYLDEMAWRFNNRRNPYLFRDTMLKLLEAKAMPFKQLVNQSAAHSG